MQPLVFSLLLVGTLAAGLARAAGPVMPMPAADQQRINSLLGPGVVGQALPSDPIQDTSVYFPLQSREARYQVTSGPNVGKTQVLGLGQARRPGGKQGWRFQVSPSIAGFIRQTEEGDLLMPAVVDAGEGVVIVTTPANPFVIKGMKPGESRAFTQQVAVNHLDDPSDLDYSGSLSGTFTYMGTYQVTVPAGTFPAVCFRLAVDGKVGPAHTQDTAYYFFAPQTGVVAMITQEDATAFWLIHIDSASGKVLNSK